MAVSKVLERSDRAQGFDAGLLVGQPWGDRVVESELSIRDVQRVVFILVDGDFQDDVLGFGAVALVAVRFDDDDPEQNSDSAWLFYWKM